MAKHSPSKRWYLHIKLHSITSQWTLIFTKPSNLIIKYDPENYSSPKQNKLLSILENLKNKFMELHIPERVISVQGTVFLCQASLSTTHPTKNSHIWDKI
jgi:hypothetical protein